MMAVRHRRGGTIYRHTSVVVGEGEKGVLGIMEKETWEEREREREEFEIFCKWLDVFTRDAEIV